MCVPFPSYPQQLTWGASWLGLRAVKTRISWIDLNETCVQVNYVAFHVASTQKVFENIYVRNQCCSLNPKAWTAQRTCHSPLSKIGCTDKHNVRRFLNRCLTGSFAYLTRCAVHLDWSPLRIAHEIHFVRSLSLHLSNQRK